MPNTDAVPLPPHALRFGPAWRFELQPAERRLLVDGQPATVGRRAMDLLVVLAERPDHLLSKGELLDRVWPGLVVEEANLQMQVSNLRKLLGGDVIATVPGRGYRFAAVTQQVVAVASAVTADVTVAVAAAAPGPSMPAPAPAAPAAYPAQPPLQAPRLIGRDDDLARLDSLLQGGAVITLCGAAGVGKTSLARVAAARWAGRSVWVDLAALAQGHQVAGALARALGVQLTGGDADAPAQLVAALRDQAVQGGSLLLVLDNAEHLVQTSADLVSLLCPLPGLQLLVTSQVPLAVAGERVLRLEPLAVRGGATPDADAAAPQGALALLIDRITAADHRFAVQPAQRPLLLAICAQLDGLPLALEMAAARVPLLGLQAVHDALARRFALLTRGRRDVAARHHTLHNALDWSYRLLAPAEQQLFCALGVFADGFTLELAVAVAAAGPQQRWDVIDGLATLAERSLLVVSADEPPRYSLLETMRAFALQQLASAAHDGSTLRRRHAAAVLALFGSYVVGDQATTASCLREMENAREAIGWAREHDLGSAAALTARVVLVTTFTVWRQESGNWLLALEPLMDSATGLQLPPELQAQWWTERARIAAIRRDSRASQPARRALALWRPLQQPHQLLRATMVWARSLIVDGPELEQASTELRALAEALPALSLRERQGLQGALVRIALLRCDFQAALEAREAEAALARAMGDQDLVDAAECGALHALRNLGRHAEAAERGHRLLARMDADASGNNGNNGNLPWVLSGLISALLSEGRVAEVRQLLPRAMAAGRRFATPGLAPLLYGLASAERRHEATVQLIGYTRRLFATGGTALDPVQEKGQTQRLLQASDALGADAVQALLLQGCTLDDAAAETLALGERLQLVRRHA